MQHCPYVVCSVIQSRHADKSAWPQMHLEWKAGVQHGIGGEGAVVLQDCMDNKMFHFADDIANSELSLEVAAPTLKGNSTASTSPSFC